MLKVFYLLWAHWSTQPVLAAVKNFKIIRIIAFALFTSQLFMFASVDAKNCRQLFDPLFLTPAENAHVEQQLNGVVYKLKDALKALIISKLKGHVVVVRNADIEPRRIAYENTMGRYGNSDIVGVVSTIEKVSPWLVVINIGQTQFNLSNIIYIQTYPNSLNTHQLTWDLDFIAAQAYVHPPAELKKLIRWYLEGRPVFIRFEERLGSYTSTRYTNSVLEWPIRVRSPSEFKNLSGVVRSISVTLTGTLQFSMEGDRANYHVPMDGIIYVEPGEN